MKQFRSFVFLLLSAVLFSCSPVHREGTPQDDGGGQKNQVPLGKLLETPEKITFSEVKSLVLQDNCIACHGSDQKKAGIDVSTLAAILKGDGSKRATAVAFNPEKSLSLIHI